MGITGTLASLVNAAGPNGTPELNGRIFTATGTQNVDDHEQVVGPVSLGSSDTTYRVNWTVGGY